MVGPGVICGIEGSKVAGWNPNGHGYSEIEHDVATHYFHHEIDDSRRWLLSRRLGVGYSARGRNHEAGCVCVKASNDMLRAVFQSMTVPPLS